MQDWLPEWEYPRFGTRVLPKQEYRSHRQSVAVLDGDKLIWFVTD
jgi:hypothetical protein